MTTNEEISRHSNFYTSTVTFLGDSVAVEGTNDENPIRIDGTSKNDFEQLMKALLYRKYGSQPNLPHGIEQWTSVLKLSTAWNFERLRQAAIDALMESRIGAVDRVVLSQRYYVKNWLLPALNELAKRAEPITLEEGRRMGIVIALKLASVRERVTVTTVRVAGIVQTYSNPAIFGTPNQPNNSSHDVAVGSCRDPRMQNCDFSSQIRSTFSGYDL
ncbi:hypothetical protein EDD16DRAFT_1704033 [Pisolithus croceorrhizus]|nr:hypothetical protein EDD16DRAFT_1704033 [Pisolithus croceorrhizus]